MAQVCCDPADTETQPEAQPEDTTAGSVTELGTERSVVLLVPSWP